MRVAHTDPTVTGTPAACGATPPRPQLLQYSTRAQSWSVGDAAGAGVACAGAAPRNAHEQRRQD